VKQVLSWKVDSFSASQEVSYLSSIQDVDYRNKRTASGLNPEAVAFSDTQPLSFSERYQFTSDCVFTGKLRISRET
jgi:hypothetical protein